MNTRGFSLVEVVLAIGIFAFAAVAVVALLGRGMKTSGEARLESVSALLSGKVNSTLRASSAWSIPSSNASNYIGNQTLAQIAAGSPVSTNIYYNIYLRPTNDPANPANDVRYTTPQFAMAVRVEPFSTNNFSWTDGDVTKALKSLPAAKNTVLLNVEVSYPALADEANRSKRYFSSIITRTSTN